MAKVLIEYEGNVEGLKATLSEVASVNEQISDSAKKSSAEVAAEYKKVAAAGKAAFASEETKKALDSQVASVNTLKTQLEKLYEEEVQLLSSGKQLTDQYKKNREEAARVRGDFDKLIKTENQQIQTQEKAVVAAKKLTTQLRDMKQQLSLLEQEGRTNTKEFQNLAIAAAKLEDQIGDTQQRIKVLASDTFKFDAAVDSVSTLAGGFAIAEGAVGLFADGNEELQQAIAKTNSALAILNGLQQVQEFVTGQSAGKLALQNIFMKEKVVATTAAASATGALATAEEGAAVATLGVVRSLNLVKIAIAGTGIGLLVIALVALYEAWEENQAAAKRTKQVYDDVAESTRLLRLDTEKTKQEIIDLNEQILVSEGKLSKAESEKRKITREASKEAFEQNAQALLDRQKLFQLENAQVAIVKKAGEDVIKARENLEKVNSFQNKSFLNNAIKREEKAQKDLSEIQSKRGQLEDVINENISVSREKLSGEIKLIDLDLEKEEKSTRERRLKDEQDALLKRKLELQAFLRESRILQKQFNDQIKKENEETYKKSPGLESIAQLSDINETTNSELLQQRATFLKKEEILGQGGLSNRINIIKTESQAQIADIKDRLGFTLDAQNQIAIIEAETQQKIRDERNRTFQESAAKVFQYADAFSVALNSIADLERQQTEQRIAGINQIRDAELAANDQSQRSYAEKVRNQEAINLRANRKIVEEKRKQARLDKALGIFNATIDTAKAIVGFLDNPGGIPGIVLSVAAGITGGVQIAKIASQPLPKYRKGGWIDGASHEGGGVHIEAEGGEYVTRRGVASQHRTELEAMNKSKAAFMKVIEERYVRPRLMAAMMDKKDRGMNVNVNASLRSEKMESEIVALRRETRNTGKVISKALTSGTSSRYHWS